MKLMIASDIHGSAKYCAELIEAYRREGADRLLLLGDLLYHGPRNDLPDGYAPKKVIELLNQIKNDLLCVRGNCEAEVDQMVLEFPVLADYALLELNGRTVFATHGHIHGEQKLPPMKSGTLLLCGHTHVPKLTQLEDGCVYVNPGSVSIPKEDSPRGYIIFEPGLISWRRLDGGEYRRESI